MRGIAAGYPDRVPHTEILGRFAALIPVDSRPNAEAEVDSTRARTINQQRDWECSGCSMVRDRPPRQPPPLQPSCTAPHPDRALLGHGAFF